MCMHSGYSRCSAKGAAMLIFSWSTLCIKFILVWLLTPMPGKKKSFWKFYVKRNCPDSNLLVLICHCLLAFHVLNSFILETLGAPRNKKRYCFFRGLPYIHLAIPKWKKSLILFVDFNMSLPTQTACIKIVYSRNCMCFAKEAVVLLLTWSILYIVISK